MTANQLTWAILAFYAMIGIGLKGPEIAYQLGRGLAPVFVTVYDSTLYNHTAGKWDTETMRKIKSENPR